MIEFIEPQKYTMDCLFAEIVQRYGPRPALAFVGETPFTYTEFEMRVRNLQIEMQQLGLKKQDKIVLLGSNSPNWAVAYIAVTTLGTVAVPVMDEFPESDVEHILSHSEAKAIFIAENLYNSLNLPTLDNINIIFNLTDLSLLKGDPLSDNLWQQIHQLP